MLLSANGGRSEGEGRYASRHPLARNSMPIPARSERPASGSMRAADALADGVHLGILAVRAKHPRQRCPLGLTGWCGCFAPTSDHERQMHPAAGVPCFWLCLA